MRALLQRVLLGLLMYIGEQTSQQRGMKIIFQFLKGENTW